MSLIREGLISRGLKPAFYSIVAPLKVEWGGGLGALLNSFPEDSISDAKVKG